MSRIGSGGRIEIASVVLDVPVVRVRQHLLECLGHRLQGTMQPHQIAQIGVQPASWVIDIGDELHAAVRASQIRVLIHLQGDLDTHGFGMHSEFADAVDRQFVDRWVSRVLVPLRQPEPHGGVLGRRSGLEEAERNYLRAQRHCRIDDPVAISQVLVAAPGIDHRLTGGGDTRNSEPGVGQGLLELVQPLRRKIADSHPYIQRIQFGEAEVGDLLHLRVPFGGIRILNGTAFRVEPAEDQHGAGDRPIVRVVLRHCLLSSS